MIAAILDLRLSGIHCPVWISPSSDNTKIRGECLNTKLKTNLIITLAWCTVADCDNVLLAGNLNKLLSDERARK